MVLNFVPKGNDIGLSVKICFAPMGQISILITFTTDVMPLRGIAFNYTTKAQLEPGCFRFLPDTISINHPAWTKRKNRTF